MISFFMAACGCVFCLVLGFGVCYVFLYLPADVAAGRMSKEEKRNRILLKMYIGHRL